MQKQEERNEENEELKQILMAQEIETKHLKT